MNFQIDLNPPTDNGYWGSLLDNGTFTGLMGDVQNDRTDVAWADMYLLAERLSSIDYTYPHLYDRVCFMVS
jgi:ABC-type amino acid transport substrate-binding protein